ncbi:MAG TPA: hypothetical protein VFG55_03490 [Rhodanobacteraceae bacterium]|nr:hypothetical protein [Rhodanobacteraceae bacterium]
MSRFRHGSVTNQQDGFALARVFGDSGLIFTDGFEEMPEATHARPIARAGRDHG